MSDLEETLSADSEGDLGVEITDLEVPESPDAPSKSSTSSRMTTGFLHWRGSFKRKPVQLAGASAIILLGLVILLSLSGTLSFLIERRPHTLPTSHLPATVNIPSLLSTVPVPQQDGLTCLTDATWSPDSKRLAVLGYSQDCPQGPDSYEPGLVTVYDTHSVKLLAQVRPDGAILSALRKQFSGAREKPVIIYDSALWSPDGRQMALPFVAHFWPDQAAPAFAGMLLMSEDGRQTVFLWQEPEVESELEASYLVWDLERGVPAVVKYGYGPSTSPFFTVNISPALTYHWEANGMLVPEISSASAGPPVSLPGPVGNPDGDASFTLWQSGSAERTIELGNGPVHFPGVYTWNTFFTAWSPDGHYLADEIFTGGRFKIPGQGPPDHQTLGDLGMDQLSTLPVRDRALQQVLDALPTSETGSSGMLIAWRPDGRVLAAFDGAQVDLYDCATGHKLASLIPRGGNAVSLGGTDLLRWSPDGSRLLLSSVTWGPVSLWEPGQLLK